MNRSKKIIGTLVPLSALRSEHFVQYGTIEAGIAFLNWLVRTGQNAWQMLPPHETQLEPGSTTQHIPSPYKGYGIGLDPRYLSEEAKRQKPTKQQLTSFIKQNADWLPDYTLFCALRDYFGTDDWSTWNGDIKKRDSNALKIASAKLAQQIRQYAIEQWQCHHAYRKLREKAKEKNILLIGDVPFYIAYKSPLVWTHQQAFLLRDDGSMPQVSGSLNRPNAYFGRQLWGHPLYNWGNKDAYHVIINLWKTRIHYSRTLFDIIRLDHANGFFIYGSLDPNNPRNDEKKPGPGIKAFADIIKYSRSIGLKIYAEDAATELKELRNALITLNVGGVRIFRFALNEKLNVIHQDYADIKQYPPNSCAYTTLHDTQPLIGYLAILTRQQKKVLAETVGVSYHDNDKRLAIAMRTAVINSPSETVIIPIQDWLLTDERINIPGTEKERGDPNWQYRLSLPVEQLLHIPL